MNKVRLGIIGLGNIGQRYANDLLMGNVARAELVAVANPSPGKLAKFEQFKTFSSGEALISSGAIDAVVIATPHPQHAALGILAFEHGLHVMMEKPIAAHKADAERLLAAQARRPELMFAAMFQFRAEPRYQKIRELLNQGELGEIQRVTWLMTDWFRTEAYYSSGGWRATWKGEGGGILLNQCPHNFDMLQWLLGMPKRVRGFCRLGRFHDIEVEDDVTAHLEYADRATGCLIASTGEAPGTNRLEISGSKGKLVLENDVLLLVKNEADALEFSKSSKEAFAKPQTTRAELRLPAAPNPHTALMQNFADAILDRTPLIAPGREGIHSLELANAILLSSLQERTIELPLDAAVYERKLSELIAGSKRGPKIVQAPADDVSASFRK